MTLIDDFEALRVPPADFGHARHVELAWSYLTTLEPAAARARFRTALRRFAASIGVPEKYDEALTLAWMDTIWACVVAGESWPAFAARNPALFVVSTVRRGTRSDTTSAAPESP